MIKLVLKTQTGYEFYCETDSKPDSAAFNAAFDNLNKMRHVTNIRIMTSGDDVSKINNFKSFCLGENIKSI